MKVSELPDVTATVEGPPLEIEHRIIGALVKRLGGNVRLRDAELADVDGLVINAIYQPDGLMAKIGVELTS